MGKNGIRLGCITLAFGLAVIAIGVALGFALMMLLLDVALG